MMTLTIKQQSNQPTQPSKQFNQESKQPTNKQATNQQPSKQFNQESKQATNNQFNQATITNSAKQATYKFKDTLSAALLQ
jgi:hypothetical protein